MKRMYLNCMFYAHFMILDIMFTFYCMKFYQRHHLMSKSFSPPQRRHGVCVTISIYTLVLPIYVLFLCDFTCVVWLMGQLWPFCVNKMTTTTTIEISLKSIPELQIVAPVKAWHWAGGKPLTERMMDPFFNVMWHHFRLPYFHFSNGALFST